VTKPATDPRVDKRKVTMRSVVLGADGIVHTIEAADYVRPDILDAYLADVRGNWQYVEVSDTPDAGPGGYEGATFIPPHLPVRDAGTYYAQAGLDEATAGGIAADLGLDPSNIILTPILEG
jgi:hypothetical protein